MAFETENMFIRASTKVKRKVKNIIYVHIFKKLNWSTKENFLPFSSGISYLRQPFETFIDFQLDARNSYIFIYNTFIKILYMFRVLSCLFLGGPRHNCIHAASGIVTLCRWLSCAPVKKDPTSSFLTGAQYSHLQRVTIPEAAYIQLRHRPPENEQGNAWNM